MVGKETTAPPNSLYEIYPDIEPGLIDILEQMLQFNPHFRPTTKELIKHPVFDKIRTDSKYYPEHKVVVDIDCNEFAESYGKVELTDAQKYKQILGIKINLVKDYIKLNKTAENMRIKFIASNHTQD